MIPHHSRLAPTSSFILTMACLSRPIRASVQSSHCLWQCASLSEPTLRNVWSCSMHHSPIILWVFPSSAPWSEPGRQITFLLTCPLLQLSDPSLRTMPTLCNHSLAPYTIRSPLSSEPPAPSLSSLVWKTYLPRNPRDCRFVCLVSCFFQRSRFLSHPMQVVNYPSYPNHCLILPIFPSSPVEGCPWEWFFSAM